MAEAISLAKELNDTHGLALALYFAGDIVKSCVCGAGASC